MKMGRVSAAVFLLAATCAAQTTDAAFQKFWAAESPAAAAKAIGDIEKSKITFDDAWKRLKAGRSYGQQKAGVVKMKNRTSDGIEHFFAVNVPENYDPAKRYQLSLIHI